MMINLGMIHLIRSLPMFNYSAISVAFSSENDQIVNIQYLIITQFQDSDRWQALSIIVTWQVYIKDSRPNNFVWTIGSP